MKYDYLGNARKSTILTQSAKDARRRYKFRKYFFTRFGRDLVLAAIAVGVIIVIVVFKTVGKLF